MPWGTTSIGHPRASISAIACSFCTSVRSSVGIYMVVPGGCWPVSLRNCKVNAIHAFNAGPSGIGHVLSLSSSGVPYIKSAGINQRSAVLWLIFLLKMNTRFVKIGNTIFNLDHVKKIEFESDRCWLHYADTIQLDFVGADREVFVKSECDSLRQLLMAPKPERKKK